MCVACRTANPLRQILAAVCVVLLLGSCNSKKYLAEDQSFLRDNKLTVRSKHRVDNKSDLTEDLLTLYRQPQTRTVAGIPRHVFYYQYIHRMEKNPDKKPWSEERIIRNRPVIFDSTKARQTTVDFTKYLALRGYRAATADFHTLTRDKETYVYYTVDPGPRTYLDTVQTLAQDSTIQALIDGTQRQSHLQPGKPMDIELYGAERNRLVRLLQNQGYARFDESYITPLEVDTAGGRVMARMRIRNPSDSTFHLVHYYGDVEVYPDFDITQQPPLFDTTWRNIKYHLPDSLHFSLKPEVINRNIHTRPATVVRLEELERTLRGLGRIELVRFVNHISTPDTMPGEYPEIDYAYYLSRSKKINISGNAELTYSNIASQLRRSLLGSALSLNYRDINIFRGAEVFNINLETGFEFNFLNRSELPSPGLLNSLNLGANSSLSLPRFYDPLGWYHRIGYNRPGKERSLFGKKLMSWLDNDALTKLSVGYNYVTIRDYYEYYTFNANLTYDIQPDKYRKLTIDRIGVDLFVPEAKPAYQMILDSNRFQQQSFGKQLFTGLLFRGFLYEQTSRTQPKSGYVKLIQSFELSGLEVLALNSAVNLINGNARPFTFGRKTGDPDDLISFSHFAKAEVDLRYYKRVGRSSEFAFRFNTGIAMPFGPYTKQVPYLKQFFVGGALSNRAWQIRELGPGSYEDTTPINPNLPFYQTGDFKIDMSMELRFPLLWYFKGALFVDAANIWTLKGDEQRPGAKIGQLFQEFGIGYGYGLRLDLTFFILRFDLGYKLHNPYPVDGSRWLKKELRKFPGGAEPQFAVGLPF